MKGACFEQKPFKTLSNIGLEVDLTPWVGILRPMTPRSLSCHQGSWQWSRSWKITRSFFSGITFDRAQLEQWKHHRCVQADDADRLICNMTFSGQVMTLTWGQIFKWPFKVNWWFIRRVLTKGTRCRQNECRVKVSLLSQELLLKNLTWPFSWSKKLSKHFGHDFYALSNAAYLVSLRGPGAQLDAGGRVNTSGFSSYPNCQLVILFARFPRHTLSQRRWMTICNIEEVRPSMGVCVRHFERREINLTMKVPRLSPGAVPTLNVSLFKHQLECSS